MPELWNGKYRDPAFWRETAEALVGITQLEPGMCVLDIGSAGGGTMFPALERVGPGGRIVGIEIEEDWVEWLQHEISKRGIVNAENHCMNGHSMSFPDASFDAAIMGLVGLDEDYDFDSGGVIDGAQLFREAFRILKPGSRLYSSNWLWEGDNEWMGELVRKHLSGCTKRGYFPGTEEGYRDLLEYAGFEEVRFSSFEGDYTYGDPAEWMACVRNMWKEELEEIKANPEKLRAFERDAFDLLGNHLDENGRIAYTRSVILVSARKHAT